MRTQTPTDLLRNLLRDKRLTPGPKLAYLWLWEHAGRRPGRLAFPLGLLGFELGRSPRTAGGWLESLERRDLIAVCNRENGVWTIHLYGPYPGDGPAPKPPDPQRRLPFEFGLPAES